MPCFCFPPSDYYRGPGPAASGKRLWDQRAHTTGTNKSFSFRAHAVSLRASPSQAKRAGATFLKPRPAYLTPLPSPTARPHQTVDIRPRVLDLSRAQKGRKTRAIRCGSPTRYLAVGGGTHGDRRSRIGRFVRRRRVDRLGSAAPQRL